MPLRAMTGPVLEYQPWRGRGWRRSELGNQEAWLAQRPRFHVHYTPTYASWLNQVERWFGLITQKAIRRGSFSSVKELIAKIEQFVAAYDKTKAPFQWTATADSILEKLQRLCSQISGSAH